jgi:hypothetical protein
MEARLFDYVPMSWATWSLSQANLFWLNHNIRQLTAPAEPSEFRGTAYDPRRRAGVKRTEGRDMRHTTLGRPRR